MPPPLSAEFCAAVPADALAKIKAIHENDNLDPLDRHDKIAEILLALGPDVHAKIESLPAPPYAAMLPDDLRARFKAIKEDKSLSFADKCAKFRDIVKDIPEDLRAKFRAAK